MVHEAVVWFTVLGLAAGWLILGFVLLTWSGGASVEAPGFLVVMALPMLAGTLVAAWACYRLEVDPEASTLKATSVLGSRTYPLDDVQAFKMSVFWLRGFGLLRTRRGTRLVYAHLNGLSAVLEAIRDAQGSFSTTAI